MFSPNTLRGKEKNGTDEADNENSYNMSLTLDPNATSGVLSARGGGGGGVSSAASGTGGSSGVTTVTASLAGGTTTTTTTPSAPISTPSVPNAAMIQQVRKFDRFYYLFANF